MEKEQDGRREGHAGVDSGRRRQENRARAFHAQRDTRVSVPRTMEAHSKSPNDLKTGSSSCPSGSDPWTRRRRRRRRKAGVEEMDLDLPDPKILPQFEIRENRKG